MFPDLPSIAKVYASGRYCGYLVIHWRVFGEPSAALETLKVVRGVLILEGKIESGDYITVRNFLSEAFKFQKNDWRNLSRITRRKCI